MRYDRCPTCKEFDDMSRHKCPPRWKAWVHEDMDEEDAWMVYAENGQDAAVRFGVQWDEGDYEIASGGAIKVTVAPLSDSTQQEVFEVSARIEPIYEARRVRK